MLGHCWASVEDDGQTMTDVNPRLRQADVNPRLRLVGLNMISGIVQYSAIQ